MKSIRLYWSQAIGIMGLIATMTSFYIGVISPIEAIGFIILIVFLSWIIWVTASIVQLRRIEDQVHEQGALNQNRESNPVTQHIDIVEPEPLLVGLKSQYFIDGPVSILDSESKLRIIPYFLSYSEFTVMFWVRFENEFIDSSNNRYLFSYSSDPEDKSGYPNAFFMGYEAKTRMIRLVIKGPNPKHMTKLTFMPSESLIGWRFVSIRGNKHLCTLSLDIDAGELVHRTAKVDVNQWPKLDKRQNLHFGGWHDLWAGGIAGLQYSKLRIYDRCFSDKVMKDRFTKEQVIFK